jgi:hypothetical protein
VHFIIYWAGLREILNVFILHKQNAYNP